MELRFVVVESDLDYYIDLFLQVKDAVREPATVTWHRCVLKYYRQAIVDHKQKWPPNQAHILSFLKMFKERKLSKSSQDDYFRSLRHFINWLLACRYIENNPLIGIDAPRTPKPLPRVPPREDVARVIDTMRAQIDECWQNCRDYAIVSLALDGGPRIGEMDRMLIDDVDLLHQQIVVYGTKDGAGRVLEIGDETAADLARWIARRAELPLPAGLRHLWISDYNKEGFRPFTDSGMRQKLAVWQRRAGVRHFVFNGLRHAYATYSLWNGAKLLDVKEQMGHSSIRSTAVYTQIAEPDRKSRHRKTSPRKNL